MVAGVEDEEFGQLVGALVAVKAAASSSSSHEGEAETAAAAGLTLEQLRSDLQAKLAGYKLPTVLRVVEGELPKGGTGKVQKKVLGPQALPAGYEALPEVQVWRNRNRKQGQAQARL
jgi:malonyl-CoA/methylmalonyl-CoA synthetase